MILVILAGGRGRRLGAPGREKPLTRVGGLPMLDRVVAAVRGSGVEAWFVAVSPFSPQTESHCQRRRYPMLATPGRGYAEDVGRVGERYRRFVTVSADLPFLTALPLRRFVRAASRSEAGRVGLLPDRLCPDPVAEATRWPEPVPGHGTCRVVGINSVVRGARRRDRPYLFSDPALAFNVNTPVDLARARRYRGPVPGPF